MSLLVFVLSFICSSCGVFLQNSGLKNYTPFKKIDTKELNDYQHDFTILTSLISEGYPEVDKLFPDRNSVEKEILERLSSEGVNDEDFLLLSRKYMSSLKNQHTSIQLIGKPKSIYMFFVFANSDKWTLSNVITEVDSSYIGQEIVSINGVEIKEIITCLKDFTFAENSDSQQRAITQMQLYNKPKYLKEIGVVKNVEDSITLKFSNLPDLILKPHDLSFPYKLYQIRFKQDEKTSYSKNTYNFSILDGVGYLQINNLHDKVDIIDGISSYVKPWLQPVAKVYVKSQFRKETPSKRLASFYNKENPIFSEFVKRTVDSLNKVGIKKLVIDLRRNSGGNLILGVQLAYFLSDKQILGFDDYAFSSKIYKSYFKKEYKRLGHSVKEDSLYILEKKEEILKNITNSTSKYYVPKNRPVYKGDVYVFSNYNTGSAAALLTTLLQDNQIAKTVGTNIGNNPIGATTYTPFKLPKTKARVSIATTYMVRPDKTKGNYYQPNYFVEQTLDDNIRGIDPYWELIKNLTE